MPALLALVTPALFALGVLATSPPALLDIPSDPDLTHVAEDHEFKFGGDSQRQAGVPRGKVTMHVWRSNQVFPGTIRRYWVYEPAQYADLVKSLANYDGNERQPGSQREGAALMVFQDGHAYVDENGQFRVPIVFDNLIHKGDMPVTIGLFIDPGHVDDELLGEKPRWSLTPSNRSVEYDTLSDAYARFLLDEILPELGKRYHLSADPEWRAIGGASSGGIAAFTVAWERPDAFRKVLSHVGSFTNIRGGHAYPSLIRTSEKRPVRVFLQAGRNDLDNQYGNWWLSNLQMKAALKFAKYEHRFEAGEGGHNGKHGGAILPDSLRWLWRGWENSGTATRRTQPD